MSIKIFLWASKLLSINFEFFIANSYDHIVWLNFYVMKRILLHSHIYQSNNSIASFFSISTLPRSNIVIHLCFSFSLFVSDFFLYFCRLLRWAFIIAITMIVFFVIFRMFANFVANSINKIHKSISFDCQVIFITLVVIECSLYYMH